MTDSSDPPIPDAGQAPLLAAADKLRSGLALLWRKYEELIRDRMQVLHHGCDLLSRDQLDEEGRINARNAAHKLAGVLGSFGLPRGTEAAREAEVMLDQPQLLNAASAARLQSLLAELEALLAAKADAISNLDQPS